MEKNILKEKNLKVSDCELYLLELIYISLQIKNLHIASEFNLLVSVESGDKQRQNGDSDCNQGPAFSFICV